MCFLKIFLVIRVFFSFQIHLKSTEGQIYVLLVNKDQDSEQPVVVQVIFVISTIWVQQLLQLLFTWKFEIRDNFFTKQIQLKLNVSRLEKNSIWDKAIFLKVWFFIRI